MNDELMSFEVRLVIARMARLVRKFDGMATGLSCPEDILELIRVAGRHERPEVRAIYDEMLYLMEEPELQYLAEQGMELPAPYDRRVKRQGEEKRPRRVYRGQVIYD